MEKIEYKLPEGSVLCLRTCDANLKSHGGFQWKSEGVVKCDDWSEAKSCGNGLHGLLWGAGDGSLLDWSEEAKWLVVQVDQKCIVDLAGKVKFPSCTVVYCGNRRTATDFVSALAPLGTAVVGGTASAGYRGTASAGYRGTASAGDGGIISIRYWDNRSSRWRVKILYPGEDGIESGVLYSVDSNGSPVKKEGA